MFKTYICTILFLGNCLKDKIEEREKGMCTVIKQRTCYFCLKPLQCSVLEDLSVRQQQ